MFFAVIFVPLACSLPSPSPLLRVLCRHVRPSCVFFVVTLAQYDHIEAYRYLEASRFMLLLPNIITYPLILLILADRLCRHLHPLFTDMQVLSLKAGMQVLSLKSAHSPSFGLFVATSAPLANLGVTGDECCHIKKIRSQKLVQSS